MIRDNSQTEQIRLNTNFYSKHISCQNLINIEGQMFGSLYNLPLCSCRAFWKVLKFS